MTSTGIPREVSERKLLLAAQEKGRQARVSRKPLSTNPCKLTGNFGKKLNAAWHNGWVKENRRCSQL